ncbi:MAG: putative AlkP superfamily phosphohydrolase/phosphomutase/tetratricopeptide (TPR) repeat protein [Chitinophagales bacterium]|jgi:predicted AlkP superfamily phosphohydrolase/phosphomutase
MKKKTKFLLIGWDSADWKVINPLIDKGQMPALESLINNGVMGNISTLDPPLSPMLWTSISTGKYAFKHGVHGFLEGADNNSKVRAVTTDSIQTSTVWEILNKQGYKTNVVGWWPSHPAGNIDGVQVSNFYGKAKKDSKWHDWKVVPNSVHPENLAEKLDALRVHPGELGIEQLASFIPNFEQLTEEDSKFVNLLLADVAECLSIHAASTYLAEHTEWDFMAVYYNAIDHISHCFMKYHPPKLEWTDQRMFDLYSAVIEASYRFHDLMLARWLELVDEETYVMVLSDHGFHSDEQRVKTLPKEPAAIAREHNYLGMIAMSGPGIRKDDLIHGSTLLDITPTILSLFDLPIGEDMDGKVLNAIFEKEPSTSFIPSYDGEKEFKKSTLNQFESDELIKQLVDLGYVENTNMDSPKEVKKLLDENNFYLARSYFDARKFEQAGRIMYKLCDDYPGNHRYLFYLAEILIEKKEGRDLSNIIESLRKLVDKSNIAFKLLEAKLAFIENNFEGAIQIFRALSQVGGVKKPQLLYQIATTSLKLHKYKDAETNFKENLKFNPSNAYALHGLGLAYLAQKKYEEAIDVLIDSVSLTYFNPSAHFHLGKAFKAIGAFDEAEQAFLVARHLAPAMSKARVELIDLYEKELNSPEKALELKSELKKSSKGTVYIVSGLPRSGTSMMMQMLEASGLEVFTDNFRQADQDNPKGYYEHEAIKRLASDNRIVYEANGKVLKVISSLIRFLPANMDYKIILMKRPVNEIVKSQDKLKENLNISSPKTTVFEMDKILENSFQKAKEFIVKQRNMDLLELEYGEVVNQNEAVIQNIIDFIGQDLNRDELRGEIDKSLYRNK